MSAPDRPASAESVPTTNRFVQLHRERERAELNAFVDALADAIAARLPAALSSGDAWMTTAQAARYLGLSVTALHKLTSARKVPLVQDRQGGKCWFKRSNLDSWRYG